MEEEADRVAENMAALPYVVTEGHPFHRAWGQQLNEEEDGFGTHYSPMLCTKADLELTRQLGGREQI